MLQTCLVVVASQRPCVCAGPLQQTRTALTSHAGTSGSSEGILSGLINVHHVRYMPCLLGGQSLTQREQDKMHVFVSFMTWVS